MPTQYGLVTGGGLNLREQASASSTRLIQIPNNTTIAVADYNDDWYSTSYGTYSGYVMKQYVTLLNATSDTVHQGSVTGGGLNLRRTATTTADALIQIPNATQIEVTDYDAEDSWYRTTYGGYAGYVMKQYVTLATPPTSSWRYGRVTSSALNVRKAPSTSAALWNNVWPLNRVALIKPSETGWYETLYRGEAAYISASFIELSADPVPDSIAARMLYLAVPELGRNNSVYFNGYTGEWCHRFADWLAMHAGQPKTRISNTSNCGAGIVWFVNEAQSGGFFFKSAAHKARMINAYPAIDHLTPTLTDAEAAYIPSPGDYIYFRWTNALASVNVSHVGIVRTVTDLALTTFEGNSGDQVVSREFSLDDERIVGYGKPNYTFDI